ncbi:MAG TPA: dihydroxy-acid dehydratase [Thermomicrobiales bacterium]|nr:dihydroxy-acid dehydratase [Thermomicrobiales bacterium]
MLPPRLDGRRLGRFGTGNTISRAFLMGEGYSPSDLDGRPVIGICNSWSELNNCNIHLQAVADAVKRGVWQAGGLPLEFPVISLGETFMHPTTMMFRNLMAMDVEEMIRAQPLDGVVLLSSCDKTTPAMVMGAASANIPAILVTGGPSLSGRYRGRDVGTTDYTKLEAEHRAGLVTDEDVMEFEAGYKRSVGHCEVMGTASTMTSLAEAMGFCLPGSANIPAVDARRYRSAEEAGKQIIEIVRRGIRPADIITRQSLENAIRVSMAIGGSTNAVVHLVAYAGRLGIDLPLSVFDALSRSTPFLVNVKPSGQYMMNEVFEAGGVPAVMNEIASLLHRDCLTVTGETIGANLARFGGSRDHEVIRPLSNPLNPEGGTAILHGNLAPHGAVIKQTAASPHLLVHRGPAVVFDTNEALQAALRDDDYDLDPDAVIVQRNQGPLGYPGMPETGGGVAVPNKLMRRGIRDIVRITDARMSGTAFGTTVLHVSPEAAAGGPLAAVRDGDIIELNVPERTLNVLVPDEELRARLRGWRPALPATARGYHWLYLNHVLQAHEGADFDFARHDARPRDPLPLWGRPAAQAAD